MSFVSYIIAGFVQSAWIALPIAIALMVATMFVIRAVNGVLKGEGTDVPRMHTHPII